MTKYEGQYIEYISPYIVGEVLDVLKEKLGVTGALLGEAEGFLADLFISMDPPPLAEPVNFQDEKDIPILWLVAAVHADFLITGDKALFDLKQFAQTAIIYPTQFWKLEQI